MIDPTDAYKPYVATADDPWDLRKAAHLHRRAGFGASWERLQQDVQAGPAASISRLTNPPEETPDFRRISEAMFRAAGGYEQSEGYTSEAAARRGVEWWLFRMVYGPDPLGEKLTLFWHNHFATALRGVYRLSLMLGQNQSLRRHARGAFGDLLAEIEKDPAMLVWLDGGRNRREEPNENFARELLELFTLGVGNYTEADIREAARALTGWDVVRNNLLQRTNDFTYRDELADQSEKTFLGQTGLWRTPDILRIILDHPTTARHLCRRLYRWFVDETVEPEEELIEPLATEYRASNYSTRHVVGIILRSRLFFSHAAYRRRVKSPVEFCVGAIRQLEPERSPNLLRLAAMCCERQGQKLFDPPSVKGWDGGRAWLNTNTALLRLNWTADLLQGDSVAQAPSFNPTAWLASRGLETASAAEAFCALLIDGRGGEATLQQARSLGHAGDRDSLLAALQVILQSPEYQLA